MPELQEHAGALGVDGVHESFPAADLLVGIQAGGAKPSATGNSEF